MMNRSEIIAGLGEWFTLPELVCPHTWRKWGDKAWQFLDTDALHVLLLLRRDILRVPLCCNVGGVHTQRGLRCNLCDIPAGKTRQGVQYLSAHTMGKAFDLTSPTMTAAEMRQRIDASADLLPCNIRVEEGVTWLHFDTFDTGEKVYHFS